MSNIPKQVVGKSLDFSQELFYSNESLAHEKYRTVMNRLLEVNHWKKMAEGLSADFKIVNEQNEIQKRKVRINDYIRLDIPGPGLPSSHGYDWVKVIILDEYDSDIQHKTFIALQPCSDPNNSTDDIAHFFKKMASTNIIIKQEGNKVTIQYAGRNEVINLDNKQKLDRL